MVKGSQNDPAAAAGSSNKPPPSAGASRNTNTSIKPRPLMAVEVLGRKLAMIENDQSPYACKIVELPSIAPAQNNRRLYVCERDHKLIADELKGMKGKSGEKTETKVISWLDAKALNNSKTRHSQTHQPQPHHHQQNRHPPASPPLMAGGSIPLKSWPNYESLIKAVETQTLTSNGGDKSQLDLLTWPKETSTTSTTGLEEALRIRKLLEKNMSKEFSNNKEGDVDIINMTLEGFSGKEYASSENASGKEDSSFENSSGKEGASLDYESGKEGSSIDYASSRNEDQSLDYESGKEGSSFAYTSGKVASGKVSSFDVINEIVNSSFEGGNVAEYVLRKDANGKDNSIIEGSIGKETTTLDDLAENVRVGVFSTSEAMNVMINTIFKQAVSNPAVLNAVVNTNEFQEFLHAPSELFALESSANILDSTSKHIAQYLYEIRKSGDGTEAGIGEEELNRLNGTTTNDMHNSTALKTAIDQKDSRFTIWSFVPPTSAEKFQLSLFLNPESGEVIQTIECQDHIFRTRYTTSPLDNHVLRSITTATREQIGKPAFVNPESLLDTVVRCSTIATAKLTEAKNLTASCSRRLYKVDVQLSKNKYSATNINSAKIKAKRLNQLALKLEQINVCVGIIYQLSKELSQACSFIQGGMWNSRYVQDVLRFPRISEYKEHDEISQKSLTEAKISIQEAMIKLADGLSHIDCAIRLGQYSLETLKYGVKMEKKYKSLLQDFVGGMSTLGSRGDIDYGCLLMTLLCSTEMINHFREVLPSADKFVRTSILTHLGKLNWETAELLGIVSRMEKDSSVMGVKSATKLRQIRRKQKLLPKPNKDGNMAKMKTPAK